MDLFGCLARPLSQTRSGQLYAISQARAGHPNRLAKAVRPNQLAKVARLGLAQAHEGVWLMSQPLDFHVTTVASSSGHTAPTYHPGHRHRWHHVVSSAHHSSAHCTTARRTACL